RDLRPSRAERVAAALAARAAVPADRGEDAAGGAADRRRRFQRLAPARPRAAAPLRRPVGGVRAGDRIGRPHLSRALAGAQARSDLRAQCALGAPGDVAAAAVVAAVRPRSARRGVRAVKAVWIGGNQARLLENGEEYFPRVLEAIASARRQVLIETFILFEEDRKSVV